MNDYNEKSQLIELQFFYNTKIVQRLNVKTFLRKI